QSSGEWKMRTCLPVRQVAPNEAAPNGTQFAGNPLNHFSWTQRRGGPWRRGDFTCLVDPHAGSNAIITSGICHREQRYASFSAAPQSLCASASTKKSSATTGKDPIF